jgi:hypothetical protein
VVAWHTRQRASSRPNLLDVSAALMADYFAPLVLGTPPFGRNCKPLTRDPERICLAFRKEGGDDRDLAGP